MIFRRPSYDEIDPGIAPLVERISQLSDVRTVGSCQGHPSGCRSPYVYFNSTVETAQEIEAQLRNALSQHRLNFYWTVQGIFNQDCRLTFLLYSPELRKWARGVLTAIFHFGLRRKLVDQDIHMIGQLIECLRQDLPDWDGSYRHADFSA